MSNIVEISGYPQKYLLLLGQSYQIEHKIDIEEAEKFEKKCGSLVELYSFFYENSLSNKNQKELSKLTNKAKIYQQELIKLEKHFNQGSSLYNNLAIFNIIFGQFLAEIKMEKFNIQLYFDNAEYYIIQAMENVEKKLTSIKYEIISEAVISNYVKIIEENSY